MRKVSPKLQGWLDDFNKAAAALIASGFKATPTNAREYLVNLTRNLVTDIPDVPLICDELVYSPEWLIPVRIYVPKPDRELPVLVYFHGGGHMVGSVSVYDPICRKLALASDHIVISVEYRLTPENPYPAGEKDAYFAVKNIWPALDVRKIKYKKILNIGGDSAGGALTASVIHKAQFDHDLDIKKAVMIYPGLDYTMSYPSIDENAVGFLLQKAKIIWYYDYYFLQAQDRRAASPIFGTFTKGLPEIFLLSCEFCPLRDENRAYLKKLDEVGVKYTHLHFDDMLHTFLNMENLVKEECEKTYKAIGAFLNK
jgi:acetyl esterase/lipase